MIATDTNVFLRRLLDDDAWQAEKARRLFETQEAVLIYRCGIGRDDLDAEGQALRSRHGRACGGRYCWKNGA
ncbi:MAG: hypothetical protein BroJett021_52530 [Chloroflexota bacterium]|nr:MAG: hypothetical protein BroJett021_52530 [Chloroflexota bacterium]